MNSFSLAYPFPVRFPLPSLFRSDEPPVLVSVEHADGRQNVLLKFQCNDTTEPRDYELPLLTGISTPMDGFEWWRNAYDHHLDRRVETMRNKMENTATDSNRKKLADRMAIFQSKRETEWMYRPQDWKMERWLEFGERGMQVSEHPDGLAIQISNALFPIAPSTTQLLLVSPASELTIWVPPHPMLKFDLAQVRFVNT